MNASVEWLIVGTIVAAAAAALGRRVWSFVRGGSGAGCGTACGRCASGGDALKSGTLQPLVQLDLSPTEPRSGDRRAEG